MKKTSVIFAAAAIAVGLTASPLSAKEHMGGMDKGHMMHGGDKEKMRKEMPMEMPMDDGMMMERMMRPTVVATSDAGVVVVMGHMLMKYDKDLQLVTRKKLDIGKKEMKAMMKNMREKRRMCRNMMKKEEESGDEK